MDRHPRHETMLTYEGRRLPRPEEEVVDQGLGFDLGTLVSRRRVLGFFGLGAATVGLAACAATTGSSSGPNNSASATASASPSPSATVVAVEEIPDETAGPYPGDGSNGPDVLEQSGIVRSDLRSSFGDATTTAQGVPMTLELTIADLADGGAPFAGVAVYVWHCDRQGRYSMYSEGVTQENYLRGVQIADEEGKVRFTSIVPACYPGRWPHIHFEVYPDQGSITDSTTAIATSQVALPKNACEAVYARPGYEASVANLAQLTLATDGVFGDDGGAGQLGAVTGSVTDGYMVTLTAGVDTTTTPTGGGMAGAPAGAPPGGAGELTRRAPEAESTSPDGRTGRHPDVDAAHPARGPAAVRRPEASRHGPQPRPVDAHPQVRSDGNEGRQPGRNPRGPRRAVRAGRSVGRSDPEGQAGGGPVTGATVPACLEHRRGRRGGRCSRPRTR